MVKKWQSVVQCVINAFSSSLPTTLSLSSLEFHKKGKGLNYCQLTLSLSIQLSVPSLTLVFPK